MAPLRERLAQESAFEAGKTFDGRAFSKAVISTTNGFAEGLLKNPNKREALKDMCQYKHLGGRSVLASLCLAANCVEKATVLADNSELRNAELEQAERLLEIPAFPNRCAKTSGVSSSFLCALAHLYLALVWKIRQNDGKVALHFLEMFIASPGSARDDLALILWEQLFLPRFSELEDWYHKEVNIILNQQVPVAQKKEVIPPPPHSFEALYADSRGFWQQLQPSNSRSGSLGQLRLEREDRLEVLKMLYQESLDENTRKFAECYKARIIYTDKGNGLNLPAVELPQIRVQIVQRQIMSRKSLARVSSAETDLHAKTLRLLKVRAEKENIGPNAQLKKSQHRNGRLARIFAEQSKPIEGSILDGTELDEMELLRVWSCPSEEHSLTGAHSRASGIEHSESGVCSFRTSSSSSSGQQERPCKTNAVWQDKLPAPSYTGSPLYIKRSVHTPTKETLTQGKGVVQTAVISPKVLTPQVSVIERADGCNRSIQKTRPPVTSTSGSLGSGNKHDYDSEEASQNASDLQLKQFTPRYSQQGSCARSSEISGKVVAGLKQAVATLCTAEDLQESEQVVPVLARVWMESKGNPKIEEFLTKAAVIDVLVEFLSISKSEEVQRATVCLLADLVYKNDSVRDKVIDYDPKVKWVGGILQQRQIPQAVVLLYLLKLHPLQLASLNIIPTLLEILRGGGDSSDDSQVLRAPKAAATFLLEELVSAFDDLTNLQNAALVVHLQAIPHLLQSFASEIHEVKISAMVILSFCMRADGKCRSYISVQCKPSSLVQLMKCSDSRSRTVITAFLCDLLRLNK